MSAMRHALLAILLLGMLGTLAELFLMEHTDGFWQVVPVVLLASGIGVIVAYALNRTHAMTLRALQALMIVFVLTGLAGVVLHVSGNVEFEREMSPGVGGFLLIKEAMMGATPALAPGTMIQLGLIGLASTFRHPVLRRK